MTDFSTLKLSWVALLTIIGLSWIEPSYAKSVLISRVYDQNLGRGLEVIARIKVIDENNEPVSQQLDEKDFTIKADGKAVEGFTLRKPDAVTPDPSRIIILLDMSGSMNDPDANNQVRGMAAIKAIRSFIKSIETKNLPTEIAILPFAENGSSCGGGYLPPPVEINTISQKFLVSNRKFLDTELSELEKKFIGDKSQRPCGATNIREPLKNAIQYFRSNYTRKQYGNQPQIRLGIILLSDGYDPYLSNRNKPDLKNLEKLLKDNRAITLHTLGYGSENQNDTSKVDITVLERLAKASGGVKKFSANGAEISEALDKFLKALLGEYEIIYKPTNTERGSEQTVEVSVDGVSTQKQFRLNNNPTLPGHIRVQILVMTIIAGGILAYLPFLVWTRLLEKNA